MKRIMYRREYDVTIIEEYTADVPEHLLDDDSSLGRASLDQYVSDNFDPDHEDRQGMTEDSLSATVTVLGDVADPISQVDFLRALRAEPDEPCETCGHIKYQHHSAGTTCMVCDCMRYRVAQKDDLDRPCVYCHAYPIIGSVPCPGTGDGMHHRDRIEAGS